MQSKRQIRGFVGKHNYSNIRELISGAHDILNCCRLLQDIGNHCFDCPAKQWCGEMGTPPTFGPSNVYARVLISDGTDTSCDRW